MFPSLLEFGNHPWDKDTYNYAQYNFRDSLDAEPFILELVRRSIHIFVYRPHTVTIVEIARTPRPLGVR